MYLDAARIAHGQATKRAQDVRMWLGCQECPNWRSSMTSHPLPSVSNRTEVAAETMDISDLSPGHMRRRKS